ncbi:surfactin synthase thioesterase subunit [Ruminiclostridium sufflavum DSM 19573]|uniref:Surfactin synthase thioesterase subunit n=1 Tax=Ruminiclostridium sufflavum DSM 19573 TaxID=1121337 RepID=A0A318XGX6_9FIRM|nr:thioesterase domain-containing protein [Ruminiclostridium sufflavum]PYG85689.1 surfactin synthase thioesterase subunit [Ruminiclostridium sufflavum DSM 19573]
MKKIRLLCFPHAGGSAATYNRWKKYLDSSIEVVPVELAGRGSRMKDCFYDSMPEAIDDVCSIISPLIKNCDYAVYGHSMGTIIAFELCHRLMEEGRREPLHLFVSGRYPPNIKRDEKYLSRLPDREFLDEIFSLGGTSKEIFKSRELLDIFIPILRADYRMIEKYKYTSYNKKFNFGITAFNGRADAVVSYDEITEWRQHTAARHPVYEFDGDHFFINEKTEEITEIINSTLRDFII